MTAMPMFDLTSRVALVTGGSRGLGKAIVMGLAEAGADVAIVSRKLDACQAVAEEVHERTGRRAVAYSCHVGRWEELDGLTEKVYDDFGRVDLLVNNAGMSPQYDQLIDVSEKLFDSVLNLNLKGPFRLSTLVGARMAAGAGGSIVNISSIAAVRPYPKVVPYAASKAGLNAMTLALAHAFGPDVRVNCVMAGPFETDVAQAWSEEMRERRLGALAAKRIGRPDEMVGTIVYLASDASSFTTGSVFTVDGGTPVP